MVIGVSSSVVTESFTTIGASFTEATLTLIFPATLFVPSETV